MTFARLVEQDNYRVAAELARSALSALDPAAQAARCGCRLAGAGGAAAFEVPAMDVTYRVSFPAGEVSYAGADEAVPVWEEILVLHYLSSTGELPPGGEPIPFAALPSGAFYDPVFQRRVKGRLLPLFGARPDLLRAAALRLGGGLFEEGDAAVEIRALPRVSLSIVLWRGDEEFPPDMSLLLSAATSRFLSTEDVAVLGGIVAGRLACCAAAMEPGAAARGGGGR